MVKLLKITVSYLLVIALFVLISDSPATAQVSFTMNEGQFLANNPGLVFQDFDAANVPPNSGVGCLVPVNSASNDICFVPGAILQGLEFFPSPGPPANSPDIVSILGEDILTNNNPPNVMSASYFGQSLNIAFAPNTDTLGMTVGCLLGQGPVGPGCSSIAKIEVYGAGDVLLGSTTVAVTDLVNKFIGIISAQPISRVVLNTPDPDLLPALLNLRFDIKSASNVPTLSEWGLIAMAGMLGLAGLIIMRRRFVI